MSRAETANSRSEERLNMFVMATLYATTGSAPVKVRNMSSLGALVEGPMMPAVDTVVALRRGSLSVAGRVAWREEGRCGLRFDCPTCVDEWLPKKVPQSRVDQLVEQTKSGLTGHAPGLLHEWSPGPRSVTDLELKNLRNALHALADDLAEDPVVLERHASKLQALDLAAQILARLQAERAETRL